jgi:hypothetical protein
MNVEIGAEAALFPEKENISWIFIAVLYGLSCFQELETSRGEVASLEEQLARKVQDRDELARTVQERDELARTVQERDELQQRLEQSLASLREAEEAERTRVEAERTRAEVERMRDKVEEDLRRQVASLSQKLDSTLQGKKRYI